MSHSRDLESSIGRTFRASISWCSVLRELVNAFPFFHRISGRGGFTSRLAQGLASAKSGPVQRNLPKMFALLMEPYAMIQVVYLLYRIELWCCPRQIRSVLAKPWLKITLVHNMQLLTIFWSSYAVMFPWKRNLEASLMWNVPSSMDHHELSLEYYLYSNPRFTQDLRQYQIKSLFTSRKPDFSALPHCRVLKCADWFLGKIRFQTQHNRSHDHQRACRIMLTTARKAQHPTNRRDDY